MRIWLGRRSNRASGVDGGLRGQTRLEHGLQDWWLQDESAANFIREFEEDLSDDE
jgi:hypothetical protein